MEGLSGKAGVVSHVCLGKLEYLGYELVLLVICKPVQHGCWHYL